MSSTERLSPSWTRLAIKQMKMARGCYERGWNESGHSYLLVALRDLDQATGSAPKDTEATE